MGKGYGQFARNIDKKCKHFYFHRYMYELAVGPIPKGMFVCHHCDVPRCGNPQHLFVGTTQDNTADMVRKGRNRCRNYEVIKALPIERMRQEYVNEKLTVSALAKRYRIGNKTAGRIVKGLGYHSYGPTRKRKYTQEQLNKARELYATNKYYLYEIMEMVNIKLDKAHFSRILKGKKR